MSALFAPCLEEHRAFAASSKNKGYESLRTQAHYVRAQRVTARCRLNEGRAWGFFSLQSFGYWRNVLYNIIDKKT